MLDYLRRLRRWWRIRRITQIRDGLIRFGDPNNPNTKWQISAMTKFIADSRREADSK